MPSKKKCRNKIYKTPPTPPPTKLRQFENGFVLDCVAVSSISDDFSKLNPKLGQVIPPYNSQNDKFVNSYFKYKGMSKMLKRTKQLNGGCSIEGKAVDYFHNKGHRHIYLSQRNKSGAGHSRELTSGHSSFMCDIQPIIGYNGLFGYRRNTPQLRMQPSLFEKIKY
ncbi:uncharacterized protein C17orf98-like [Octopus sinensis]|uniref:Uncharacterized protein C17orf98-like n=1 Tax=Octopus sinensis TaxID=2607531 RepID=A0A6P7SFT2_9MOLL|nr:uncharacterized protein C17orf98-like [Octopus sinensis]